MTTVVLADRDPDAVRAMLSAAPGITVVAAATTSHEVTRETVRRRPDVVLLDPELDQHAGVVVIGELLRSAPATAVLGYSSSDEPGRVAAVMRAGARGYVLKTAEPSDIVRAIHSVAAGEVIFGAHIAPKVTRLLSGRGGQPFGNLTGRERQVLELIAAGLSNSAIARRLRLAPKTIRNNTSMIFGKLNVSSRTEAIARTRAAISGNSCGRNRTGM